ncbi:uncharacterized protein LOC110986769 isoform X2 [Acanthaster planci]|uniref:Uncharacterized protein LOC110986769 isoform X2 n=1 Tax=Acanthaster planci TaxID=133434 RepID=A0A8B7ZI12_ACAPL|nr:uncharacterized protein LOC110986769 isoform X2 [Acanthaster planci]
MLKTVFIALVHTALWIICSAVTLPPELQGLLPNLTVLHDMRRHFCLSTELHNASAPCTDGAHGSRSLCGRICQAPTNSFICYDLGPELCRGSCDRPYCRYEDALVCQYAERQCSCIYSVQEEKEYAPFCNCRNDASLPTFVYQNGSSITSTCSNGTAIPVLATSRTTSSLQSMTGSSLPSTAVTSIKPNDGGQVKLINVILGVILAFSLLVLLVVIFLWHRGKLSAVMSKPPARTDASANAEVESTGIKMTSPLGASGGMRV